MREPRAARRLAAVAAGGVGRGSVPSRASAKTGRLEAFGSCSALLGYVQDPGLAPRRAVRVRRRGLFGTARRASQSAPAAAASDAAWRPKQGVDYSGTNVQEEGVDEPDLVKTNGNDALRVANGRLNAVDVRGAKPRLLDTLKLDAGWSHELLLHGDRLLVLSRGGYWAEPLPGIAARDRAVPARAVRAGRGGRLRSGSAAPRPHADARRRLRRRAARRRQRADRRRRRRSRRRCRSCSPDAADRGGARRGDEAQPRRRRLVAGRELAARPTGSSGRARSRATSARSSSAATCAGRPRSRGSACSRC